MYIYYPKENWEIKKEERDKEQQSCTVHGEFMIFVN